MKRLTTKTKTMKKLSFVTLAFVLLATACKKDDDPEPMQPENEEEVITTMILTYIDQMTMAQKQMTFQDLDGDGGNAPTITADALDAGATYDLTILLLNETETPADTISNEVADEDDEHQFFFQVANANLSVDYADMDGNGDPVGLTNVATCGAASTGTMTVTLRHQPNKGAAGVSDGDIMNAGGETDIEVTFDVVVQ